YIGSTTEEYLSRRMVAHRSAFKKWKLSKKNYTTVYDIFDKYGVENCSIELLESCPCESIDALHAREAYYIKSLSCVNKNIPGRTDKEYYQDNKDAIKKYHIQYQLDNKDMIKERQKQ
ncbi:hypothetical protein B484DRAFT_304737, partial [Ochromonadaceae sp. CCMP2298]